MSEKVQYLRIGKICGAHGLKGRLKIFKISDVNERFTAGKTVYLDEKGDIRLFTISDYQLHKGRVGVLALKEVTDRNRALQLKGLDLMIPRSEAESTRGLLEEGAFYYYELIGCEVYFRNRLFGSITEILEAGSGNVLLVKSTTGSEYRIPFVDEMVDTSRVSSGRITITPVEGIIEE